MAFLELCLENQCSSYVGMGISGKFGSCRKGVQYLFAFQEECGLPLQTLLKRPHLALRSRISSCDETGIQLSRLAMGISGTCWKSCLREVISSTGE